MPRQARTKPRAKRLRASAVSSPVGVEVFETGKTLAMTPARMDRNGVDLARSPNLRVRLLLVRCFVFLP